MSLTDEQKLAVESIDKNVLVSAGAGSGKTHVLVERFLEILRANQKLSVGNIIAVTYTHKAANEMRSRLKERMEELSHDKDKVIANRWQECLAELDGAKIGTIHSLCQNILRAFPEEAIVDPAFSVLDEMEGAELLEESLEEVLYEAVAAKAEVHDFLTAYPVDTVRKCLEMLVKSPITFFEARESMGDLSEETLTRLFSQLASRVKLRVVGDLASDKRFCKLIDVIADTPFSDEKSKLEEYRRSIVELATTAVSDGPIEQRFDCLRKIKEIQVRTSGGKTDEAQHLRDLLKELKEINKAQLPELDDSLNLADRQAVASLKALIYLADMVLAAFSKKKLAQQKLDFNDQIMLVYKLLSNPNSRARHYYNQSVAAVLIDEFQDTNAIQAEILERLAGKDARLFLIGDDKQSIYKFQGAEVETFNRWREHILNADSNGADAKGLLVRLSMSFRSHPHIVSFVNFLFEHLLDAGRQIDYRARFQSLSPHRTDSAQVPRVEFITFDGADEEGSILNDNVRSAEGDAVACWINEKIKNKAPVFQKATGTTRPIKYGDFAVLVQARKDFAAVEHALAAQNIPYITVAGSGLLHCQEIYDLESALAFVWCPEDSHALLAVLRSPLVGLGDDVIQQIASMGDDKTKPLWLKLQEKARQSGSDDAMLKAAVFQLKRWIERASLEPVGRLVQAILADSKYEIVLLATPNGKQRARNVLKFQQLSFDHNHMPVGEFLQALTSMRELSVRQSAAPLDMGDSVRLMTIHAAKGLEFPAVILPVLDSKAISNTSKLIFHRQFGMVFNTSKSKSDEVPALFTAANHMERDMQVAEKKRLFYVAATRARDYLSLFVERGGGKKQSFAEWLLSAIDVGDFDEGPKEELLSLGGGAKIQLRRISSESLNKWQQETVCMESPMTATPKVSFNPTMLERIEMESDEPTIDSQQLNRITPLPGQEILPTISGQYFHLLMQRWQPGWNTVPDSVLHELAQHKEIRVVHPKQREVLIANAQALIAKFIASDLYKLWGTAKRSLREMPYLIAENEDVYSRRPDLLFEDKNGQWHIVDFKTDHFEIADIDAQTAGHTKQLLEYVCDIETLTGARAKAFVYFAQHGILKEVSAK